MSESEDVRYLYNQRLKSRTDSTMVPREESWSRGLVPGEEKKRVIRS